MISFWRLGRIWDLKFTNRKLFS